MPSDHARRLLARFSISKMLKWGGIAVIMMPLVVFLIFRASITLDIKRLENRAHERGEPLTVEELKASMPDVPDEENAAVAIIKLWTGEKTEWTSQDYADAPVIGSTINEQLPWTGIELTDVKRFQKEFEEFYFELRQAVELPRSRIPLENTKDDLALSRYWLRLKRDRNALLMLALLAAQEEREEDALFHFETSIRLINTLKDEPDYLGQWARAVCGRSACHRLADLVGFRRFSESSLDRFEELVISLKHDPAYYEAMLEYRVRALATYSWSAKELGELGIWPDKIEDSPLLQKAALGLMRFSGWWGMDRRLTLETYDQILVLTNTTSEDFWRTQELMKLAKDTADRFPPRLVFREQSWYHDSGMKRFFEPEAFRRMALIVIGVERYRLANGGKLPETLNLIKRFGPDPIPIDPFDGHPLRYIIRTNGYWMYSVHVDRQDNQGGFYSNARDLSLRVEWPEVR